MRIEALELRDFRNCAAVALTFDRPTTYIVGANAQGKTSLLEAVYCLGHSSSFRSSERTDLIRHGCDTAVVRARAVRQGLGDEFALEISAAGRRWSRNGKPARSRDEHWPQVILFAPEETLLFKGAPQGRRDYLDAVCEGCDPRYRAVRRAYQRTVEQRNRLLKLGVEWPRARLLDQLAPWDAQLVTVGCELVAARAQWVTQLAARLPEIHGRFAPGDGQACLAYCPQVATAEAFQARLAERREEEIARGVSVVGPQRDDLEVTLDGRELRHFGSQGQHRSVILSLKLAEVALAIATQGEPPILLLDDVASELDDDRLRQFFAHLRSVDCQILVTATDAQRYLPADGSDAVVWRISQGRVG